MNIGILGSGVVGQTLGAALARKGHEVMLGTRRPDALDEQRGMGRSLQEWLESTGGHARVATFADAAAHGGILINATSGKASLQALEMAGAVNLSGKTLIDVSNPLDFSQGFPPTLTICNEDSLGEQIQKAFPETKVVKALNTVTAALMVEPDRVGEGEHDLFICGNDDTARARVGEVLREWFGWKHVIDLGDITMARGTEMYLALWVRTMSALGTPLFNVRIVR